MFSENVWVTLTLILPLSGIINSVSFQRAATAVVVTSKPQKYNNDIIWFPDDNDDRVFVSIYGEKFRTPPVSRSRSHRRARFSGQEPIGNSPFVQITGENYDPSFFHNIHERREVQLSPSIPKIPPSFSEQQYPNDPFPNNPFLSHQYFGGSQNVGAPQNFGSPQNFGTPQNFDTFQNVQRPQRFERPQNVGTPQYFEKSQNFQTPQNFQRPVNLNRPTSQNSQNSDDQLQDLINEVFGKPPERETPEYFNLVGSNKRPSPGKTQKHSEAFIDNRPSRDEIPDYSNVFDNNRQTNEFSKSRPGSSNKNLWDDTRGESTAERPTEVNRGQRPNRPNKPRNKQKRPNKPNRTTTEPGFVVFPDETTRPSRRTTTTTTAPNTLPTEPPTMSPCERKCRVTPEYNPVCGSDSVTYTNEGRLKCAQYCGKDVVLSHYGNCGRGRFTTPLVSDNVGQRGEFQIFVPIFK